MLVCTNVFLMSWAFHWYAGLYIFLKNYLWFHEKVYQRKFHELRSETICARVQARHRTTSEFLIGKVNTCTQCAAVRNIRFWCGFLLQAPNLLSFTQKVRDFYRASESRPVFDWLTTFLCGSNRKKISFFSWLFSTNNASHVCVFVNISHE